MSKNKYTGKIPDHLNKGGRPKFGNGLNPEEKERYIFEFKRTERLNIRFSKLEKEQFNIKYLTYLRDNKLNKSQLSINVFIINLVLDKDLNKIYKDNNLSKLSFDINKIGINVNQIAKRVNSYTHINNLKIEQDLLELKKKLNDIYLILDKK